MIQRLGFEVLDPWVLTDQKIVESAIKLPYGEERRDKWMEVNVVIASNNVLAIRQADLLVACLDGSDVDSGTAGEIGFAYGLGKPIEGYRSDFRQGGDNEGATINLQIEYFIFDSGGSMVRDLEKLKENLQKYLK